MMLFGLRCLVRTDGVDGLNQWMARKFVAAVADSSEIRL